MYKGKIVCSLSGHDKGIFSIVIGQSEDCLLICDGKHHKLLNPKRKKLKHLCFTEYSVSEELLTDKQIRKAIYRCLGKYKED